MEKLYFCLLLTLLKMFYIAQISRFHVQMKEVRASLSDMNTHCSNPVIVVYFTNKICSLYFTRDFCPLPGKTLCHNHEKVVSTGYDFQAIIYLIRAQIWWRLSHLQLFISMELCCSSREKTILWIVLRQLKLKRQHGRR